MKTISKKKKWEERVYPTSRHSIATHVDTCRHVKAQRTVALNRRLGTEGANKLGGEKAAFSANGPAATGHPEAENEPSRKMHTVNKD